MHLDPGPVLRQSSFTAAMQTNQVPFMLILSPKAFIFLTNMPDFLHF